jgi:rhodanese-related sulfurtransferase
MRSAVPRSSALRVPARTLAVVSETFSIQPSEVAAKVSDGWTLLDVRTDDEWSHGHIPGAVHLPMDQVVARLDEIPAQVVCICAVGARSERVAQYLNAQGREAVNLDGGTYGWIDAGLEITA